MSEEVNFQLTTRKFTQSNLYSYFQLELSCISHNIQNVLHVSLLKLRFEPHKKNHYHFSYVLVEVEGEELMQNGVDSPWGVAFFAQVVGRSLMLVE